VAGLTEKATMIGGMAIRYVPIFGMSSAKNARAAQTSGAGTPRSVRAMPEAMASIVPTTTFDQSHATTMRADSL
jgi:hypothetical protein